VQVDDAVYAFVLILQRNVILDRAQVVTQVLAAGGAGAGKNASLFGHGSSATFLMSFIIFLLNYTFEL
jgi:hypothetical protein